MYQECKYQEQVVVAALDNNVSETKGGGALPYLKLVGNSLGNDPLFGQLKHWAMYKNQTGNAGKKKCKSIKYLVYN